MCRTYLSVFVGHFKFVRHIWLCLSDIFNLLDISGHFCRTFSIVSDISGRFCRTFSICRTYLAVFVGHFEFVGHIWPFLSDIIKGRTFRSCRTYLALTSSKRQTASADTLLAVNATRLTSGRLEARPTLHFHRRDFENECHGTVLL